MFSGLRLGGGVLLCLACCSNTGLADVMLLKYTADASLVYLATGGSPGPEDSVGVGLDSLGNAFVAGGCEEPRALTFGPLRLPAFTGRNNGFMLKVSPTGAVCAAPSACASLRRWCVLH
jgi:hypothetical protein